MARLEEIITGSVVQGLVPGEPVTVVTAQWHGTSVLQATYRLLNGRVEKSMLYRDDEARLVISQASRPWAFDAPGAEFRLVSEAQRINLAALFDPLLAVHSSLVRPLPHQLLAVYDRMIKLHPLRFLLANVEILLATDAAGEGINLQRAHLMVNYDLPWNPNRLEQRFGRIHRIGQTEVCHLWNLLAAETREGDVYRRLLEKIEAQRAALGGRVYDVLGRIFEGRTLRDLLMEAVSYRFELTGDVDRRHDGGTGFHP